MSTQYQRKVLGMTGHPCEHELSGYEAGLGIGLKGSCGDQLESVTVRYAPDPRVAVLAAALSRAAGDPSGTSERRTGDAEILLAELDRL